MVCGGSMVGHGSAEGRAGTANAPRHDRDARGIPHVLVPVRACRRSVAMAGAGSSATLRSPLLLLFFILLLMAKAERVAAATVDETALRNLYNDTGGAFWRNRTGWGAASGASTPPCVASGSGTSPSLTWFGITCSSSGAVV